MLQCDILISVEATLAPAILSAVYYQFYPKRIKTPIAFNVYRWTVVFVNIFFVWVKLNQNQN